ncbi:MAG: helix-turn-helix domain-containing protein [Bacteroidota bacterium]
MIKVNENIKFLRKRRRYTQEQFAELIGIKRSLVGAYEEGRADPRLNNLIKMSEVFKVSLDALISKDVSSEEAYNKNAINTTSGPKVLAITVDKNEKENIEFVQQKASAGYLNGFSDPEYVEELPKFNLPNLPTHATYRAFEINGDSMLPLQSGTIIIGQYLEQIGDIRNGKTYVLLTKQEGVVYKRVFNYIEEKGSLFLVSDNKAYSPYEISPSDVLEIWESRAYVSMQFPDDREVGDMTFDKLTGIVLNLQSEVIKIKDQIS